MRLRQFIAWAATLPAIIWSVYGGKKSGQCATEEMYHSAAEIKRALARREAAEQRDRDRELRYIKYEQDLRDRVNAETDEKFQQATADVRRENKHVFAQNTKLRDFIKKHGLWEQYKRDHNI